MAAKAMLLEPCPLVTKQAQWCCIGLHDDAAHGNRQYEPILYNNLCTLSA
jgi:hypothetical protein